MAARLWQRAATRLLAQPRVAVLQIALGVGFGSAVGGMAGGAARRDSALKAATRKRLIRKRGGMSSGLDMKRRKPFNSNAGARDSKLSRQLRRILPPRGARMADLPETDTHRKVPSLTRYLMPLTFLL